MKLAFLVHPHVGGTFTVYRQLRAGLAGAGVALRWVAPGRAACAAYDDPAWAAERPHGDALDALDGERDRAVALIDALRQGGYDGVFVNVLTSRAEMSVVRHLPRTLLRIMIVHNITSGTYAAARAIREHVHACVGVSRRIQTDLVRRHGFVGNRTFVIANGIEPPRSLPVRETRPAGTLRVLFLGRVEEASKGVFSLPRILDRLDGDWSVTVAGDGPDLPELRRRLARWGGRVRLLGAVPPANVPQILARHDALLMPSRFEGFGYTLIEAMAAGCVPVASRIRGVTDAIVESGRSGVLFPVGDARAAAAALNRLAGDPALLCAMASEARTVSARHFTADIMASAYLRLIRALDEGRPPIAAPLELTSWSLPGGCPGLRWVRRAASRIFGERLLPIQRGDP